MALTQCKTCSLEWQASSGGEPCPRCHLAAERKRREEAEAFDVRRLSCQCGGSGGHFSHCTICGRPKTKPLTDSIATLRADNARLRAEMQRILDSGNLFEHHDIARAALNR